MRALQAAAARVGAQQRETHISPQVPEDLGLSGAGVLGLTGYGFAVEPVWRLEVTRYASRRPTGRAASG